MLNPLMGLFFYQFSAGIFFVIYWQSGRWRTSFKIASLITAGLIPVNPELLGNNNQVYHERLLLEEEFNLFEDSDQRVILAKNSGEAEAFPVTPINKAGQNRNVLFGTGNGKNNPDDDPSDSNTPFSDFKENRKENRAESKNYEHQIYKKMSDKDANSETDDESECSIDEVKTAVANDGTFINAEKSQVRDKNNLPDEIVIKARDKILNFMTADDTKLVPGFLGYSKIEGTVFINLRLNKVGFRDNNGYIFRTAMTMNDDKILKLAKTDFHLFPDAGKP